MTVVTTVRQSSSHLPGGWVLATVEARAGSAEVTRTPEGDPRVVVCDTGEGSSPAVCSSVVVRADGTARVEALLAPPALWLTGGEVRLAPQVPTAGEDLALAPGDLVVLCTAEVLEHLPHGLPHLAEPAAALPDPQARVQSLAADLRAATPAGAAAVLCWDPGTTVPPPA